MPHALIVDDDAFNLDVLGMLLRGAGVTYTAVQEYSQLAPALNSLTELNIVFLDLEFPKRNGYEMLQELRQQLPPNIFIVACTVHTNEIETAYDLGFNGFISKPLDHQRFPDQLNRLLSGEPVWE